MSAPTVDLAQYEKLVHQLAWRYARRLPSYSTLCEETLAQEGWLVLTKAVRSYQPGKAAFMTYAYLSLARRYAELVRQEHRKVGAQRSLEELDGSGRVPLSCPPTQTLVETRVDLARGHWDGPPFRTGRQAEEARERLLALA